MTQESKDTFEHFKLQLGPAWKRNLKPGQIPIPEKAYYVDLATETAEDCSDARVNLTVYSPLPTGNASKSCKLVQTTSSPRHPEEVAGLCLHCTP